MYSAHRWDPKKVLPLQVKVNLVLMVKKGYSIFPKTPELKPHHQMHFTVTPRTLIFWNALTPQQEIQHILSPVNMG